MKISEMILREDFYKVNEETLASCYHDTGESTELFVYSRINAIITRHPGKKVRRYLYTEYSIRGHFLKRWLIYTYMFLLFHSGGAFANYRISVQGRVKKNNLLYPCNRKYRIFDFDKNEVMVIVKAGFLPDTLHKEISFRENNRYSYVLPLLECGSTFYIEKIIDGIPLARIQDNYEMYLDEVLYLIHEFNAKERVVRTTEDYARELREKMAYNLDAVGQYLLPAIREEIGNTLEDILGALNKETKIEMGLSHGDLQPGNIWVERKTNKVYIIDWESWDIRSVWYDKAVLLCDIRNSDGIRQLLNGEYKGIFPDVDYEQMKLVVAAEDLLYKVEEVSGLPEGYGICQFMKYLHLNYKNGRI